MTTTDNDMKMTITKLDEIVAGMLVENTGIHMLDSGGSMGRAWQRNQAAVGDQSPAEFFENTPVGEWGWPSVAPHPNFREGKDPLDQRAELWVKIGVYHFLTKAALSDFNEEMDTEFQRFADLPENEHSYWLGLMEDFPEHWARHVARKRALEEYEEQYGHDAVVNSDDLISEFYSAPYGLYEGEKPLLVYTYNHDNALSQDIQYLIFGHENESYVLLQIHGGADARGGLTMPRAFDLGREPEALLDDGRVACSCDKCHASWYSDSAGSSWENDDHHPNLDEIPAIEGDRTDAVFHSLKHLPESMADEVRLVIIEGESYAPSNTVCCPICGLGTITPFGYTF